MIGKFKALLLVRTIRVRVGRLRLFYYVRLRRRLETRDSKEAFETTLKHNLQSLKRFGMRRMARIIKPLVAMWWSRPFHGKASSSAAQLDPFDMDRIRFQKGFLYLTDVTPESGPHGCVRGSHATKPAKLWRDERISDKEMAAEYEKADLVEICGEAGTILAVDTVGFHKSKALTKNERLLLQFEFANSLFGANYPRQQVAPDARLGEATRKYPPRYGLFTVK